MANLYTIDFFYDLVYIMFIVAARCDQKNGDRR